MKNSLLNSTLIPVLFCLTLINCNGPAQSPMTQPLPVINNNAEEVIASQKSILAQNPNDASAYYRLAFVFMEQENFSEAEEHIKRATQLAPINGLYFELLGEIALRTKRYGISENAFKSAIRLKPDLLSSYLKLALVYEIIGEYERGSATLEEAINREPRFVEALYHLARLKFIQKEYEEARKAISAGLLLEPNNWEMMVLRVRIISGQGNYYYAKTLVEQLLEKRPQSYLAKHEHLKILFAQQDWDSALLLIEKMEQSGSLKFQDQLIQVQILIQQFQLIQAKKMLENLLNQNPLHPQIMIEFALLLIQEGDLTQALVWLNRSLEIDEDQAHALYLKASILFKSGDFLHGDLALNRVLDLAPLNRDYQLLSLRRRLIKGEFYEVEQQLNTLLKKDLLDPELLRLQVDLLTLQGKYGEAEKLIRQIQLVQDNDILQFSLARVFYFQQKYQALLAVTEPLIQKYQNDWESHYLHAVALYRLGGIEMAVTLLNPLMEKKNGEGFIHRLVGDFYRYQGKEEMAQETYLSGLENFPRNIYLVEALSASYLLQQKWELARDLILKVLEQEHPLKSIFLDRMIYISEQLKTPKQTLRYLQLYNQAMDPVLKSRGIGIEKRLLFPVASPVLGYQELFSPSAEETPNLPAVLQKTEVSN
ncbi:MAG: tetratricopeptide repeat protein [SAR324 cluster bacterium]|nr:tetratricopeptide repeat protein [SAR324 cluster bacterium]